MIKLIDRGIAYKAFLFLSFGLLNLQVVTFGHNSYNTNTYFYNSFVPISYTYVDIATDQWPQ